MEAESPEPCTSSSLLRKCCIHMNHLDSSDVKKFNTDTFEKCKIVLRTRRKFNMLYTNFDLPTSYEISTFGYHTSCYRKFTAVKKDKLQKMSLNEIDAIPSEPKTTIPNEFTKESNPFVQPVTTRKRRTTPALLKDKNTGILRKTCIFCNKQTLVKNKQHHYLTACATKNIETNIKKYATVLQDRVLLAKISDIDFIAKEVFYHRYCRTAYQNHYLKHTRLHKKQEARQQDSLWHVYRKFHKAAFTKLIQFIDKNLTENEFSYYMHYIYSIYGQIYFEESNGETLNLKPHHLQKKLLEYFGNRVTIKKYRGRCIIHSATLSSQNAISLCVRYANSEYSNEQKVAFKIRRDIFNIRKKPLPTEVQLKDIYQGELEELPKSLYNFISNIFSGPASRRDQDNIKNRIESIVSDIIFCTTNGRIKPSKQMLLGLVMKSLTSSKKVINILNRLGHASSYSFIEELETELTYSAMDFGSLIPDDISKNPNLGISVAFDNFDRYVETLSGKDTLHDTVGIIYQNKVDTLENPGTSDAVTTKTTSVITSRKRRRAFTEFDIDIEPYYKKPKLLEALFYPSSFSDSSNYKLVRTLDNLWVISLELIDTRIPMWTGWNNKKTEDNLPLQKVCYLPSINASPTSLSVVVHTLNTAKHIANECSQPYISVTYDLAIAKLAYQIQSEEAPIFDNIFVQLGAFHIQMSYFKAIGKYIEESGGPYILTESKILAPGSLKGFLTGTHFNRCKRIHPIFLAALQTLHFQEFCKIENSFDIEEIILELQNFQTENINAFNLSPNLTEFMDKYDEFYNRTKSGEHGENAKFWITYIDLVKLYLEFARSIRMGDFDLYVTTLPKLSIMMFVMNHQNYSRWILKYHNNLVNMHNTHPGLKEYFLNGGFSVRRTNKSFSRNPIDLTLEQTINADAANKLTGISAFTNSITARRRWALSHSLRTSAITHLLKKLNLNDEEDVSNDLRPHRIKADNTALKTLLEEIKATANPFNCDSDILFNLSTGREASEETREFLLNVISNGTHMRDQFITECQEDSSRFEKPIKRTAIKTFACENKLTVKKENGKLQQIRIERNLIGRLLVLALQRKIDLEVVLSYPLTAVPLSMCHIDGHMNKTDKSKLLNLLEHRISSTPPSIIDCTIIDGFYFLHLLGEVPLTYGKLATYILTKVLKCKGQRIDLIFDKFISPSIKDIERENRAGFSSSNFIVTGAEQRRPTDFSKALRNDTFKSSLVSFLVEIWSSDSNLSIIQEKVLRVNCNDVCYMYYVEDNKIMKKEDQILLCTHEEADSRIIFHLSKLPEDTNVIIKASDTDVAVIALGNFDKFPINISVWLELGLSSKNTLRHVNINEIYSSLGHKLAKSLPAYHALTGCDYTAAFARKGKIKPFALLEKDSRIMDTLSTFGSKMSLTDQQITIIDSYICKLYARPKLGNVNEARFDIFIKNYSPKLNKQNPLENIKNMDSSLLPPCRDVLIQKLKRVNQVCAIWNHATESEPPFYDPIKNGWVLIGGKYRLEWYTGQQSPASLDDILVPNEEQEQEENDDDHINNSSSDEGDL